MKTGLRLLITGIFLFFLTSCVNVVHLNTVRPGIPGPAKDEFKRVVILPFADHTPYLTPTGYYRRNIILMEAMKEDFEDTGLMAAPEEGVITYLFQRGIIKEIYAEEISAGTAYLQSELEGGIWSDSMQKEIEKEVFNNMSNYLRSRKKDDEHHCMALDNSVVKELGKAFRADYVIRGRVMEFTFRQEETFFPSKTGILNFFFPLGQKMAFGTAKSATYEMFDGITPGSLMKMDLADTDRPLKIGGAGSKPMVRLSMVIQDAVTGEIIWSDTADVRGYAYESFTNKARKKYEVPLARAIRKASKRLVISFMKYMTPPEQTNYE